MKKLIKIFAISLVFELIIISLSSCSIPRNLDCLKKSYPDYDFDTSFDIKKFDYLITVSKNGRYVEFYWAGGKLVPVSDYENRKEYNSIFYEYQEKIPDPSTFTEKEIEKIREYTNREKRKSGNGYNNSLYDFVYDCETQLNVERHIVPIVFLGKPVNVHQKIISPLKTVEARIYDLAQTDEEVARFIQNLDRVDCYNWREISDSGKKSKHSMGIAIDVLPKGWGTKNLYWAWRRDIDPKNWMLLPLDRRWLVPEKVVKIFEEEGFVYGAKWIIWDNMHFEYNPELIEFNKNPLNLKLIDLKRHFMLS